MTEASQAQKVGSGAGGRERTERQRREQGSLRRQSGRSWSMVRSRGRRRRRREDRAAEAGAVSEAGGRCGRRRVGRAAEAGAGGSERAEQQRPELDREPAAEQGQEPGAELGAAK